MTTSDLVVEETIHRIVVELLYGLLDGAAIVIGHVRGRGLKDLLSVTCGSGELFWETVRNADEVSVHCSTHALWPLHVERPVFLVRERVTREQEWADGLSDESAHVFASRLEVLRIRLSRERAPWAGLLENVGLTHQRRPKLSRSKLSRRS